MGKKSNTTYAASTNCSVTYFRQIMKVGMPHNDDSTPFKNVTQRNMALIHYISLIIDLVMTGKPVYFPSLDASLVMIVLLGHV